jgi:hypothetical protein
VSVPSNPVARRQFLRMLTLSAAAVVLPVPVTALAAARRPPSRSSSLRTR